MCIHIILIRRGRCGFETTMAPTTSSGWEVWTNTWPIRTTTLTTKTPTTYISGGLEIRDNVFLVIDDPTPNRGFRETFINPGRKVSESVETEEKKNDNNLDKKRKENTFKNEKYETFLLKFAIFTNLPICYQFLYYLVMDDKINSTSIHKIAIWTNAVSVCRRNSRNNNKPFSNPIYTYFILNYIRKHI